MDKRNNILVAAEKLLAERGFYGLSMKTLAQNAGIAAGTIYRYFESKEMLMIELHQHISRDVAKTLFSGWSDEQSAEQKYVILWRNAFDCVLRNPQRLMVMEMLSCMPNKHIENAREFEDITFFPLINFYQQGIDEQRFKDWSIAALMALSFDSAINLAKKALRERLTVNEHVLTDVREASWQIIQIK